MTIKRTITAFVAVIALSAPLIVSALTSEELQSQIQRLLTQVETLTQQFNDIQADIASTTPEATEGVVLLPATAPSATPRVCGALTRPLAFGTRGDDVGILQDYLRDEGYFNATSTGYFGTITREAMIRWQISQGVVLSHNSPGAGLVGPRSRSAIARQCASILEPPAAATTTAPTSTPYDPSSDKQCKSWFDGCNTCSRSTPDGEAVCTLRACLNTSEQKPECRVRFDDATTSVSLPKRLTVCTLDDAPVCGRLLGCANTCPEGKICPAICQLHEPKTYSNTCVMEAAGATLVSTGTCPMATVTQ